MKSFQSLFTRGFIQNVTFSQFYNRNIKKNAREHKWEKDIMAL